MSLKKNQKLEKFLSLEFAPYLLVKIDGYKGGDIKHIGRYGTLQGALRYGISEELYEDMPLNDYSPEQREEAYDEFIERFEEVYGKEYAADDTLVSIKLLTKIGMEDVEMDEVRRIIDLWFEDYWQEYLYDSGKLRE